MKVLLYICLFLMCFKGFAQERSINFEIGSFQEVLDKAKETGRLLFIDCYTSWCGPCKYLAREVFTNNEVADYFNAHFISWQVDCEKGEGIELRQRFNVSAYPTLLFVNGEGKLMGKFMGASEPSVFLEKVKECLDPKTSLSEKERRYQAGERGCDFLLDLIASYKEIREDKKAAQLSNELLASLGEEKLLSKEMWDVISFYFVSPYGSPWWNFIVRHGDEYERIVGKEILAKKIAETVHVYLFMYAVAKMKAEDETIFENIHELMERYELSNKETLEKFIILGRAASFKSFDRYFRTILNVVPKLDQVEHYRFVANTFEYLYNNTTERQKQQLLDLLEGLSVKTDKVLQKYYQKFIDKLKLR